MYCTGVCVCVCVCKSSIINICLREGLFMGSRVERGMQNIIIKKKKKKKKKTKKKNAGISSLSLNQMGYI